MKIRRATQKDQEKLLSLVTALHVEYKKQLLTPKELVFEAYQDDRKAMAESTSQYLTDPNFITFIAKENNQCIGYIPFFHQFATS